MEAHGTENPPERGAVGAPAVVVRLDLSRIGTCGWSQGKRPERTVVHACKLIGFRPELRALFSFH